MNLIPDAGLIPALAPAAPQVYGIARQGDVAEWLRSGLQIRAVPCNINHMRKMHSPDICRTYRECDTMAHSPSDTR